MCVFFNFPIFFSRPPEQITALKCILYTRVVFVRIYFITRIFLIIFYVVFDIATRMTEVFSLARINQWPSDSVIWVVVEGIKHSSTLRRTSLIGEETKFDRFLIIYYRKWQIRNRVLVQYRTMQCFTIDNI